MTALARRLWLRFEPYHAVTYFTPESRAATDALGCRGAGSRLGGTGHVSLLQLPPQPGAPRAAGRLGGGATGGVPGDPPRRRGPGLAPAARRGSPQRIGPRRGRRVGRHRGEKRVHGRPSAGRSERETSLAGPAASGALASRDRIARVA